MECLCLFVASEELVGVIIDNYYGEYYDDGYYDSYMSWSDANYIDYTDYYYTYYKDYVDDEGRTAKGKVTTDSGSSGKYKGKHLKGKAKAVTNPRA